MSYIKFDKSQLINLQYSLSKELLRSNRAGAYASTSIIYCNTRKYHGLLVCPVNAGSLDNHVLLSCMDEVVKQHDKEFNLSIRKYPGTFNPLGHKYIRDFHTNPIPTVEYRVGNLIMRKEILFASDKDVLMIKYTLVESSEPTKLLLKPFLAFRSIHDLMKANLNVNSKVYEVKNGIKISLYSGYPWLHMQLSKPNEFVVAPDWYYNIEYPEEQKRGHDYQEDLFIPGFFEIDLQQNESVILSVSVSEENPDKFIHTFTDEIQKRVPRTSFELCLQNAAEQFVIYRGNETHVLAGFHWFGSRLRDTFMALPGLMFPENKTETFELIIDKSITKLQNGFFAQNTNTTTLIPDSSDNPLWLIWAIQQYMIYTKSESKIWKKYQKTIIQILGAYINGESKFVKMDSNFLIYAAYNNHPLTWMDAVYNQVAITPRQGFAVEVNALWYNAVCFTAEMFKLSKKDKEFTFWNTLSTNIQNSFISTFWNDKNGYLFDYVNSSEKNKYIRPNQLLAISLPYCMVTSDMAKSIIDIIEQKLLTSKGLRTLAPDNKHYAGNYEGLPQIREKAYTNGTVWPWLLAHFADAYLKIYERTGLSMVKKLYYNFEEDMVNYGIGTIAEIYDGDPPHLPRGAISSARSVAEVRRLKLIIDKWEHKFKNNNDY